MSRLPYLSVSLRTITLRFADIYDLPYVKALDDRFMLSSVSGRWLARRFESDPRLFFVALDAKTGQIVGYICGRGAQSAFREGEGYVSRIVVDSGYQHRGVGTLLLMFFENALLSFYGHTRVNADVRYSNDVAIRFYVTNGYQIDRRFCLANAYESGETEADRYRVAMYKSLAT